MTGLLSGVAVVVDDNIFKQGSRDKIHEIVDQIEVKNIPLLKYDKLPEDEVLEHFNGISFLILDWDLRDPDLPLGSKQTESQIAGDVVDFIKQLRDKIFGPIFIFTATSTRDVKKILEENGLSDNSIIVARKALLLDGNLFDKLNNWIESAPPVYVLKEWEREYNIAKNATFLDFYNMSHSWPKVLWANFNEDGVDTSLELGEVITRNIQTRMSPFNFDQQHIFSSKSSTNKSEIQSVLEGERYLKISDANLSPTTGDIFKEPVWKNKKNEVPEMDESGDVKYKYFLNIRAQCDLVRRSNPTLYLLKGRETSFEECKGQIHQGGIAEKAIEAIVPFIADGKIIRFEFYNLETIKWGSMKKYRTGRLLDPYITQIQQRYSLHQQRKGLPRIPDELLPK